MKAQLRALCLCRGGNTRSMTLARMLKRRGFEALPAGVDKHAPDTLLMLGEWANVIYVADASVDADFGEALHRVFSPPLLEEEKERVQRILNKVNRKHIVGKDDWQIPDHPDLIRLYRQQLGDPVA